MKPKQIFISILAVLFVFPLMGTFAQQAPDSGSIEVITTLDYPGIVNSTQPQKINERGDIVGIFVDSNSVTRGFVRFSNGSFSAPIVDPNDTVGFTEGRGINNSGTVCGDYASPDGNNHGSGPRTPAPASHLSQGYRGPKRGCFADLFCRQTCRPGFDLA
jgi:hypothetical protein